MDFFLYIYKFSFILIFVFLKNLGLFVCWQATGHSAKVGDIIRCVFHLQGLNLILSLKSSTNLHRVLTWHSLNADTCFCSHPGQLLQLAGYYCPPNQTQPFLT